MKKTSRFLIIVMTMIGAMIVAGFINGKTYAKDAQIAVPVKCYEGADNKDYKIDDERVVSSMSYGKTSIGTLNIAGTDITNSTYSGFGENR